MLIIIFGFKMAQKVQKQGKQCSNIEVFIRIRPFSESQAEDLSCINTITETEISLREKQVGQAPSFVFDRIFDIQSTQEQVYDQVTQNMVDNAFEGINSSVFCYGQTSSGKTFTCIGKGLRDNQQRGILPRMIQEIFQKCQRAPKHIECKMKISMIEIYNQKIKDLLDCSKHDLKIRSDKSRGIFVENVTQKYLLSQQEANLCISKGIENRSTGCTNMNAISSRSHMLFIITVHQHDFYTGQARAAKITLVDLAGSEKISRTGAEGKLLQQAKKINTSLSALGKVINILSEGKKSSHVPYRDSKLTRLLQQSLGGNSITKLIINISPALVNQQETISSLRFGHRAKSIKNEPRVNKEYTVPQLLELLNKADKKNRILTSVIKQIMKQKEKQQVSFKQFVKSYLKQLDPRSYQYQSDQTDEQNATSLVKSFSGRGFPAKKQGQNQRGSLAHVKSLSSFTSDKDLPANNKLTQRFNQKIDRNSGNQNQTQKKTGGHSLVNLFRSPCAFNQLPVPTSNKHIKRQSFSKQNSRQRPIIDMKPDSDNDSIIVQKHDTEPDNSQSLINLQGNPNQLSNIVGHDHEHEDDKHNFFVFNSQDGRSFIASICTLNSKVLDVSVSGTEHGVMSEINRSYIGNHDHSVDLSLYEEGTIQFNLERIRSNLRRIKNLKERSFIV